MMLTEFLLARITEDEATAHAATPGEWEFESAPNGFSPLVIGDGMAVADTFDKPHLSDARHIARYGPARVLADCAAKRGIVGLAGWTGPKDSIRDRIFGPSADIAFQKGIEAAMRALASVYADHPDFDESWRP